MFQNENGASFNHTLATSRSHNLQLANQMSTQARLKQLAIYSDYPQIIRINSGFFFQIRSILFSFHDK